MDCAKVAAVLLAAGRGSRFGGNKLEALLGDTMLGLHAARTLAGMGCGHLFAVHDPGHRALATALRANGYTLIGNEVPDAGLSHSLSLAAGAALVTDADALLICLADMPFVTAGHLQNLIAQGANQVIASTVGDVRMPPALFPRSFWPMLATLSGDAGGRTLLRDAVTVQGSPEMLADIDTRADLNHWS